MSAARIIRGHVGIGPAVTGRALVARDYFSARYDLDRIAGVFSRPQHALYGQSYVGKVLVLLGAKGGVATAWMLHDLRGLANSQRGERLVHARTSLMKSPPGPCLQITVPGSV